MAEQLGDLRWLALLREHNAIVRDQIAQYGGFEVKTIGDAFMVASKRAQPSWSDRYPARDLAVHRRTPRASDRVRIGLHAGEPVRGATTSTARASSSPHASLGSIRREIWYRRWCVS
jgi:class 3 adenylate cyclase